METGSQIINSSSTMTNRVIHKPGFADVAFCERLIECWERHHDLTSRETGEGAFFDNRVLHVREIHAVDPRLGVELLGLAHRMAVTITEVYAVGRLYPDDVQVVKWWEGHEMVPHADMEHPDGAPHPTPWRSYAGVVYLNEDYRGGQIYFPHLRLEITPASGDFLAFGGSLDFLHGVRKIRQGMRYTCPSWFTHHKAHAVELYLQYHC